MQKLLIFTVLSVLRLLELDPTFSGNAGQIISSPCITNWGLWSDWTYCKPEEFVKGMQLKWEPMQGQGDDTSLNGIRLICALSFSGHHSEIQSAEGGWGDWGQTFFCPKDEVVTGFQLKSEADQGTGDDTAANNLRLFCNSPSGDIETILEGDAGSWGSWTDKQTCPNGQAVTGFRTQVESDQRGGDDTTLNNLEMVCSDQETTCLGVDQACEVWKSCCSLVCQFGTCTNPAAIEETIIYE